MGSPGREGGGGGVLVCMRVLNVGIMTGRRRVSGHYDGEEEDGCARDLVEGPTPE